MSNTIDISLLSLFTVESNPKKNDSYIIKLKHKISADTVILKVIDARAYPKENVNKYLTQIEKIQSLNETDYLMKYLLIKEMNGYIYLMMNECEGSLSEGSIIYTAEYYLKYGNFEYSKEDEVYKNVKDENKNEADRERKTMTKYDILLDVLHSIRILHSNGFVNGNLKSKNVLYNKNHFIVSDYCKYLLYYTEDDDKKIEDDDNKKSKVEKKQKEKEKDDDEEDDDDDANDDDEEDIITEYHHVDKQTDIKCLSFIIKSLNIDSELSEKDGFIDLLEEIKCKQPIDEIIQTVHNLGEKTLTFNIWNMEDFDYKVSAQRYKCEIELYKIIHKKEVKKYKKLKKEIENLKSENEILRSKICGDLPAKRKKLVE